MLATYLALAILGCGYVVASAFFGILGTGDGADGGAGDAGHVGADGHGHDGGAHYGVDGSGHGHAGAGHGASASFHFPLFSPLALAAVFGSLGAYGIITSAGLGMSDVASLLVSIPAAIATAYAVTYVSFRIVSSSVGSSQIRNADLVGATGEVITPIPGGGMGEVAASVRGQRFTSSAREESGGAVPRGATVVVVRMVGSTLIVKREQGSGG